MSHNKNGIWHQATAETYHQSSHKLAQWLAAYLPSNVPVVDFGCGLGYYVGFLQDRGFEAYGVEGAPLNFHCLQETVFVHDLTQPLTIVSHQGEFSKAPTGVTISQGDEFRGSVISLEVGEHLPASAQETFMQTLVAHCAKHLILSWAEIGQPGIGHINCRSQQDVIADVERRGFKLNQEATADARNNIDDNTDWFRRTLLVFERI